MIHQEISKLCMFHHLPYTQCTASTGKNISVPNPQCSASSFRLQDISEITAQAKNILGCTYPTTNIQYRSSGEMVMWVTHTSK